MSFLNFKTAKKTAGFLLCFFLLSSCQTLKQPPGPALEQPAKAVDLLKKKKKLALFISGAGAGTFSALGLLELFHQNNIHFDFLSGSGWGAWLTALYSARQSADDLKWHLFKLKEQKVFESKWLRGRKKQTQFLKTLTKEALSEHSKALFFCPALNDRGQIIWISFPARASFACINKLSPLFLSFDSIRLSGSLFSAEEVLNRLLEKTPDTLIWIRPAFSLKALKKESLLYWKELYAYLNHIQKKYSKLNILILNTKSEGFSPEDFSRLSDIIKTPASFSAKAQIRKLKDKPPKTLRKL